MKFEGEVKIHLDERTQLFYDLLCEEDYDFKNKEIEIDIHKADRDLLIHISAHSLTEYKIASTALIKSLEVIEKTLDTE